MIENISIWTKQIILAVIIASIIELITPNGKNKKYIKMIIGMYILLIIISPITSKFTKKSLNVSNFDYEKYFENSSYNQNYNISTDLEKSNNKIIENTYVANIKKNITNKVNEKGYDVKDINIQIDTTNANYGKILKLNITIKELEENNISNTNEIIINKIEIGNKAIENTTLEINKKVRNKLIDCLCEEYEISRDVININ